MTNMENLWIMAQTAQTQGQSEVPAEPVGQKQSTTGTIAPADSNTAHTTAPMSSQSSNYMQLLFIGGIFVVMYFILFREPRKRQRQQQQMIQSIKKNDKVRTVGGIIGIVVDVKDDEIVLKVDESNNTKIRIMASAIGKNLSNEEK
jgi:preprotein translocase subunit YajC